MTTDATLAPGQSILGSIDSSKFSTTVVARCKELLRRTTVRVFLIYSVIALIPNLPSWPGDPNRIATCACGGFADPNQTAWFLMWTPFAILHGHNPFFTSYINYPSGADLAENTGIPLLGIITAPLTLLVNPVASMNLLRWLAFVLSAFAAYFVIRRLVRYAPAAFIGGLLYGFSPYMVTQGSVHLDLAFAPLPPLILYAVYEIVVCQQASSKKWGLIAGLCATAQFYISAEVLATTAIVASIGLFYLFFLCIKQVRPRVIHGLTGLSIAIGVTGVCIAYPLWMMFHGAQHYIGPAQGYAEVYNADLLGPFLPTMAQLFAPADLATIGTNLVGGKSNIDENGTYLGIPLILITLYFVGRYWRRLWMPFLLLMAATVFVLSLGPYLYVDGKFHHLPFNLPFRKINHFPGINNVLPVRFSLYVMFFVALIIALGIDFYRDDVVARRAAMVQAGLSRHQLPGTVTAGRVIGIVVSLAAVVALLPNWPYVSHNPKLHFAETKAGLSIIPTGSVVLTYPYVTPYADDAMEWQAMSGMRFKVLGSYALVRSRSGGATTFPAKLQPTIVEAMLANSITPVPDPALPAVVVAARSMVATSIRVVPRHTNYSGHVANNAIGQIAAVPPYAKRLVIDIRPALPINVDVTPTTTYFGPNGKRVKKIQLVPGERVQISGTVTQGTINPHTVQLLRQFVVSNHINAIDIELGRRDSAAVVAWMKLAFGKPTRAGGGGEFWIHPTVPLLTTAAST